VDETLTPIKKFHLNNTLTEKENIFLSYSSKLVNFVTSIIIIIRY
jgi:hypothetical protein